MITHDSYTIIDLHHANESLLEQAAKLLMDTFLEKGIQSWPTIESARKEVTECVTPGYLCFGAIASFANGEQSQTAIRNEIINTTDITNNSQANSELLGWIGLRPMYTKTWEMHPLAVSTQHQGLGIGRTLLEFIEHQARNQGIEGIFLGTDDETGRTSLSGRDFPQHSLLDALKTVQNTNQHPLEFYQKCGYQIVGAIPHANGFGKPDIFMWKSLVS
jgi:aminoglycoside 6'-N-acetyltransferase I